jgi:hypothetical protein
MTAAVEQPDDELGRPVLPEHVATAVYVLVAGGLSRSTGLHLPVDGGVAAAFLQ